MWIFIVCVRVVSALAVLLLAEPLPVLAQNADVRTLAQRIDRHLSRMNCEYADRLATRRLNPLRIQEVVRGTWNVFRSRRIGRLGGSLEQYKHPCLSNELEFYDRLLQLKDTPVASNLQGLPQVGQTNPAANARQSHA